jgi:hypothetical protein
MAAALAECEAATTAMNSCPPTGCSLLDREPVDALCEDVRRALQGAVAERYTQP